jgi:hypothetical protein
MSAEDDVEIRIGDNGHPILDQFSEEGFVDLVFRIVDRASNEREHRLHLAACHDGHTVGFDVHVGSGLRGGFDDDVELIAEHVYRDAVRFMRCGPESDRLMTVLAELYGLPHEARKMVDSFGFTAILLHKDGIDMSAEPTKIKIFGNDGEDSSEDDYFESFFNLHLGAGFVFWNEKDSDYRAPLIAGLSVKAAGDAGT